MITGGNHPDLVAPNLLSYIDWKPIAAAPSLPIAGTVRTWAQTQNGITRIHYQDSTAGDDIVIGRDLLVVARNVTGVTLTDSSAVYISGSTGSVPTVALAKSDSITTLPCVGVVMGSIVNNGFGYVHIIGIHTGVNTSGFNVGDELYVSPTTAGLFTNVKPNAPFQLCAVVISKNANGTVYLRPYSPTEAHTILDADEHSDTVAHVPVRGDLIVANSTPKWSSLAKGTANQVLSMDGTGTDVIWAAASGGMSIGGAVAGGTPGDILKVGAGPVLAQLDPTTDWLSQYALLAGRSGGQTLIGGTAASNSLTLQSTSNGTKGLIIVSDALRIDNVLTLATWQATGTPGGIVFEDVGGANNDCFIARDSSHNLVYNVQNAAKHSFMVAGVEQFAVVGGGLSVTKMTFTGFGTKANHPAAINFTTPGGTANDAGIWPITSSANTIIYAAAQGSSQGKHSFFCGDVEEFTIAQRSFSGSDTYARIGIGQATPLTALQISGNRNYEFGWYNSGALLRIDPITITDENGGTYTRVTGICSYIGVPTIAANATSGTYTDAPTLYIAGGPAAGANATITNSWGLWNVGKTRLDDIIAYRGGNTTGAQTALLGTNGPMATATAPYTWFTFISNDGSTVYVPAWK